MIEFSVFGTPQPQGSKKAWAVGGRATMAESGGATHAAWRNAVAQAANDNIPAAGCLDGPLQVVLAFWFPMPASRSKAIRSAGKAVKTTAPDIDKLQRAVLDGLQAGGLIRNDSLVYHVQAGKWETRGWTGVRVTIASADEVTA